MSKILPIVLVLCFTSMIAQDVEFKKVKPHPSVSMKIPETFVEMLEEDVAERFVTAKRPHMVYTDIEKQIELDINVTINDWGTNLKLLKDFYKSTIYNAHKKVKLISDSVVTINNRDYAWLEYTSSFGDKTRVMEKHYSNLMFTVIEKKIVVTSFKSPKKQIKKWQPISNKIFQSLKMKSKILQTKEEKEKEKLAKSKKEDQKKVNTTLVIPGKAPAKPK